MITNYIKRYAENIHIKNDICDFSELGVDLNEISAVSWERPNCYRREFGAKLLKDILTVVTGGDFSCSHIMVQLTPEQPNTAIVNYKKTWGLIEKPGVNFTSFQEKKSFIDKGRDGLILTGTCRIPKFFCGEIQELINTESKVYFSNIKPVVSDAETHHTTRLKKWINNILKNNGVIFYILGRFDENDVEVVAIGKKNALKKLL